MISPIEICAALAAIAAVGALFAGAGSVPVLELELAEISGGAL